MKQRSKRKVSAIVMLLCISTGQLYGQAKEYSISPTELNTWALWGQGAIATWGNQTSLQEADETKGILLVSPNIYGNDVILRYKTMALTPATVMVTLLAVSDPGDASALTIPNDYDGGINLITEETENYFFAFKNAPHNNTPFVQKSPNSTGALIAASENKMIAGVYYDIEIGKKKGKLWLKIDNELIFETEDKTPLAAGHIALRLRGTAGFKAGCLIKDMVIVGESR
ncbi:hypothetical protein N7E81_18740 [Reichenbachiella carrageenanivorans]|uniref:3-keto-disaccharide hydrolase domain-containing protein n=1 Tax=Reichenbachiella carrageenanivorans TaxID=2979869 RepID=A0ABY6D2W0_9BACT|nr:hypothetical protein [Reichenbachiella carrageenanivorans]UXX79393.1 hypothetical protein N7E81_18740 [Reichenbachiella carrageenanivorans]